MAARLGNEPGIKVEVVDGNKGEFTVALDGRVVAQKDQSLPDVEEVVAAVHRATSVRSGA